MSNNYPSTDPVITTIKGKKYENLHLYLVEIYRHEKSNEIKFELPLLKFSHEFIEMYMEDLFVKIFMSDGTITAKSIHKTFFIPQIKEY